MGEDGHATTSLHSSTVGMEEILVRHYAPLEMSVSMSEFKVCISMSEFKAVIVCFDCVF